MRMRSWNITSMLGCYTAAGGVSSSILGLSFILLFNTSGALGQRADHHASETPSLERTYRNYSSIVAGDLGVIDALVGSAGGIDGEISTPFGNANPLRLALIDREQDLAIALIRSGASLEAANFPPGLLAQEGLTVFLSELMDLDLVEGLEYGEGLKLAAISGYLDTVSLILSKASERDISIREWASDAFVVALLSGNDDIAWYLVEKNLISKTGDALLAASRTGQAGLLAILLEGGADPNYHAKGKVTWRGRTPLDYAWTSFDEIESEADRINRIRVMRLLLESGATAVSGENSLEEISRFLKDSQVNLKSLDTFESAVQSGDYIAAKSKKNDSLSMHQRKIADLTQFAISHGFSAIARLLIKIQKSPTAAQLHSAIQYSSPGIVRALLRAGADPNEAYMEATAIGKWLELDQSRRADFRILIELLAHGADTCAIEIDELHTSSFSKEQLFAARVNCE